MQTTCPATDRYLSIQQQRPTHPLLPSLNHLRYDESTYLTDLGQSRGPGSYVLETPTPHCKPCFANDAMLRLLGRTADELPQLPPEAWAAPAQQAEPQRLQQQQEGRAAGSRVWQAASNCKH